MLRLGDPRLRQPSQPVENLNDPQLSRLVEDLRDTMEYLQGAGLAAPQIGVGLRVVMFGFDHNPRYPDAEPVPATVLINPQIDIIDAQTERGWEGCLSVPGMRGEVARPRAIRYRGFDLSGRPIDRQARGFHARVVQHECDHLDGILYPDRISDFSRFGFIDELTAAGQLPPVPA